MLATILVVAVLFVVYGVARSKTECGGNCGMCGRECGSAEKDHD